MPYFKQRLRADLVGAIRWRQHSYLGAFVCATSLAALLLVTVTVFVMRPKVPHQIRVALSGRSVVEVSSDAPAEPAVSPGPAPRPVAPRPTYVADTVTIPRIEMVPSADPDAELVRRLAAAASENVTVDARPVGSLQVSEYELSNGQRVMVLDRMAPKTRRKTQPVIYY